MTGTPHDSFNLIAGRRSVRSGYDGRPIPASILDRIVNCGLLAPCSKGAPPWSFTVVTDRGRLARLAGLVRSAPEFAEFTPHSPVTGLPHPQWTSSVLESAEVLERVASGVFVENSGPFSGGRRSLLNADPGARALALTGFELELAGIGAALENMWLAAIGEGLSATFMGDICVAESDIKLDLGLEGDLIGVLALGYADGAPVPRARSVGDARLVRWNPKGDCGQAGPLSSPV